MFLLAEVSVTSYSYNNAFCTKTFIVKQLLIIFNGNGILYET